MTSQVIKHAERATKLNIKSTKLSLIGSSIKSNYENLGDIVDFFHIHTKLAMMALLPPANEVWGKVICLHLSVILSTGGSGPRGCLVWGVPGPRGIAWSRGGACSWRGCLARGCLVRRCLVETPWEATAAGSTILLECIIVANLSRGVYAPGWSASREGSAPRQGSAPGGVAW